MALQATSRRIRPAQPQAGGFRSFDQDVLPSVTEMAFDKLTVTINGRVNFAEPLSGTPGGSEGAEQETLFNSYRDMLCQRAADEGTWQRPKKGRHFFSTHLPGGYGTITSAKFQTTWRIDGLTVRATIGLNPTRTMIHAFAMVRNDPDPLTALSNLPVDRFFAHSPDVPTSPFTLDGSHNAFRRVDDLIAGLGEDYAGNFIAIFEAKLKEWVLDAVAPLSQEFVHGVDETEPSACGPLQMVALAWPRLYLNDAEVYFERQHPAARTLMERSMTSLAAAQSDCTERRYGSAISWGRERGCATVMVKQTSNRQVALYAKTPTRVRIETRFRSDVKGNLRDTTLSEAQPMTDTLLALRQIASRGLRWDELCGIVSEPVAPTVTDLARLVVLIMRCCNRLADPEQVLSELLTNSSIVETDCNGRFPHPLIHQLEQEGLIRTNGIIARRRPLAELRHYLAEPHATVVQAAARGFQAATHVMPAERQRPAQQASDPHSRA